MSLPAVKSQPMIINYDDSAVLATLKATVAKDANDAEFAMFIQFAKSTGLNPWKKEIWFIKDKNGRVVMMTGINGFYAIANAQPEFDGIEAGYVSEKGEWVKSLQAGEKFIGAWARCYRKDRRVPFEAEARLSEFGKSYGNWTTMPGYMIKKVAESHALRKSFPQQLNGLYAEEEMPKEFAKPQEEGRPHFYDISKVPDEKRGEAEEYCMASGMTRESGKIYKSLSADKRLAKYEVPAPTQDDLPGEYSQAQQ